MDWQALEQYEYELPDELVAATPSPTRSQSRLVVADIDTQQIRHVHFEDLPDYLDPSDLVIFNDTRVVHARIATRKPTGGAVELFVTEVVRPEGAGRWQTPCCGEAQLTCMTRSSKPIRAGTELTSEDGTVFEVVTWDAGIAVVRVETEGSIDALLHRIGEVPLPPYIVKRREAIGAAPTAPEDEQRYQTVYASQPGAVAAPTAGLHFDEAVLSRLDAQGTQNAALTLHVGPGTFRPVTSERLDQHEMHSEEYEIPIDLRERIESCEGRVVAVGTTTVRALETEARRDAPFEPGMRKTNLFISPGFEFEVVDAMVTNFHLPRSTLLALVYAFGGPEFMRKVYDEAVRERYRFYSYGDAMLLGRGLLEGA